MQNVILYTQNMQEANQEIELLGGRITQQFTNIVFVAILPDSVATQSLTKSSTVAPSDLDEVSLLTVNAWINLQNKFESASPNPTDGLSWGTPGYDSPLKIQENVDPLSTPGLLSTGTPTSLYMVGSIAVGVIIVSGPSSTGTGQPDLSFSKAEQQKVIQEVEEGLNFLANLEPRANITFVYDIQFISVTVAPGSTTDFESAESPWRNAALQQMGFAATRQGSQDYVQQLRKDKGTSWVYVAYFTKYPLHHFAYAVSEKICMEYSNDSWGSDNINRVFAHETCHIFGAADEYGSCVCGGGHGYLGIPNNNCVNCGGTQVSCVMDRNDLTMCDWTRGQIGWNNEVLTMRIDSTSIVFGKQGSGLPANEPADQGFKDYTFSPSGATRVLGGWWSLQDDASDSDAFKQFYIGGTSGSDQDTPTVNGKSITFRVTKKNNNVGLIRVTFFVSYI